jgi:hypothetical protein
MSLGQFLFTKLIYLNYLIANTFLRLVNILAKEKIFLVPIYEPNQQCLKFNEQGIQM